MDHWIIPLRKTKPTLILRRERGEDYLGRTWKRFKGYDYRGCDLCGAMVVTDGWRMWGEAMCHEHVRLLPEHVRLPPENLAKLEELCAAMEKQLRHLP